MRDEPRADAAITWRVALVRDAFYGHDAETRLRATLAECRELGADVALLPEIPLHPWSPATKEARAEDAEEPGGPRERLQRDAAREAGIALIGGTIRATEDGRRENTALVITASGELHATYAKLHIPEEPGFWETSHYSAGTEPPEPIRGLRQRDLPFGVQICSDVNRPMGSHLLAARGARWIANPRATEQITYPRWRTVFVATALTTGCYVLSACRPEPEQGVLLGGSSFAVAPTGEVLCEGEERIQIAELSSRVCEHAAELYPGYLPVRSDLYARGWARAARG